MTVYTSVRQPFLCRSISSQAFLDSFSSRLFFLSLNNLSPIQILTLKTSRGTLKLFCFEACCLPKNENKINVENLFINICHSKILQLHKNEFYCSEMTKICFHFFSIFHYVTLIFVTWSSSIFLFIFSMKVFGIDDNSEAFSLLVTVVIGVLLAIFTYLLNERVMSKKRAESSDVSVAMWRDDGDFYFRFYSAEQPKHNFKRKTNFQRNQQRGRERSLEAQLKLF